MADLLPFRPSRHPHCRLPLPATLAASCRAGGCWRARLAMTLWLGLCIVLSQRPGDRQPPPLAVAGSQFMPPASASNHGFDTTASAPECVDSRLCSLPIAPLLRAGLWGVLKAAASGLLQRGLACPPPLSAAAVRCASRPGHKRTVTELKRWDHATSTYSTEKAVCNEQDRSKRVPKQDAAMLPEEVACSCMSPGA